MTDSTPTTDPIQSPTTVSKLINSALLWKLVGFELLVMCAWSAGTFYLSWMGGDTDWGTLDPSRKMMFKVGMAMQVLVVIKSFISKTVANVQKGINMPPIVDGPDNSNTTVIQRKTTQTYCSGTTT
jgi:hypothetical protein